MERKLTAILAADVVGYSRLIEQDASPGSTCISGTVYDQVKGKLNLELENFGRQQLKNITEPVRVLVVRQDRSSPAEKPALSLLENHRSQAATALGYFFAGRYVEALS